MKVLIIAPFYRFFVKEYTDTLAKYVDEIHVVVHHNIFSEIANYIPLGGFFDHVRNFTYNKIVDLYNTPSNINVHVIDLAYAIPDNKNPLLPMLIYKSIIKKIGKDINSFDIIHSHFTWPSGAVGLLLKHRFNIPLVITTHGLHMSRLHYYIDRFHALEIWRNADALINVSPRCSRLLLNLGLPKNKIYYIPNGVDFKKFSIIPPEIARKKLGLPIDKKIIISVGNLVEKKGFKYGILAMREIVKTRDDTIWYIVGEGYLRKSLEALIHKLKLEKYITLVGFRPHKDIPVWMNAGDIFLLPSLVENFGVVNIEAMACGKPVVSTYNGGSEYVILQGKTGFLCLPKDPNCLSKKILLTMEKTWNPQKIRKYAMRFSWDNIAKSTLRLVYLKEGY